jgi:5-formyltetrahydrofolate cyclo-ligase
MEKAELRSRNTAILAQINSNSRFSKSQTIISQILAQPKFAAAMNIMLFAPRPDEPDIWPLFDVIQAQGKNIFLPAAKQLAIGKFSNKSELVLSTHNIFEPQQLITQEMYTEIELVICPGLVFDQDNYRLGHGSGWYDRMLPRFINAYKIGICFSEQLIEQIPHDTFDQKVDLVISD